MLIPARLAESCRKTPERSAWLAHLPVTIDELTRRWSITLEDPIDSDDVSCSWVAFATRTTGSSAVLKLGMPHMEGDDEIRGLQFWNGEATVQLLEHDVTSNAMLLERCVPGHALRTLPEEEQDVVIAGLTRRLWRAAPAFRPLEMMVGAWADETLQHANQWPDGALVRDGLVTFERLLRSTPTRVLLATDLHAGNVLRAERQPWLVIDPKPFVGDPAYDATQHLLNCRARLRADARSTIGRFADLLGVDPERVRLWTFARLAAEPRVDWADAEHLELARSILREKMT